VKQRHHFDERRLATALREFDRVPARVLEAALTGPTPFPRALVEGGHVTDWEISKLVCEIYALPFVPVDRARPDPALLRELWAAGLSPLLRRLGLVPLARNGSLLTVAMPALVPSAALVELASASGFSPIPVVGTVLTNARWLEEHLAQEQAGNEPEAPLPKAELEMDPSALPRVPPRA
jgi:hypothetical protein